MSLGSFIAATGILTLNATTTPYKNSQPIPLRLAPENIQESKNILEENQRGNIENQTRKFTPLPQNRLRHRNPLSTHKVNAKEEIILTKSYFATKTTKSTEIDPTKPPGAAYETEESGLNLRKFIVYSTIRLLIATPIGWAALYAWRKAKSRTKTK